MAGTMSALASCGLHRSVVRHSVTTTTTCRPATDAPVAQFPNVHCSWEGRVSKEAVSTSEMLRNAACGLCLSLTLATALPAFAAQNSSVLH